MIIPRLQPILNKRLVHLMTSRSSAEYNVFKEKVLKRDEWTCQFPNCKSQAQLEVHHIRPFSKDKHLRTDEMNGITLCHKCHSKLKAKEQQYEMLFFQIVLAKYNKKSE